MKQMDFVSGLMVNGLVDERGAGVVAHCQGPAGYGMCLVCVKGGVMRIYETDFHSRPGALVEELELKELRDVKSSAFLLHSYLKFTYRGQRYRIKDFGAARNFLDAVLAEAGVTG